MDIKQLMIIQAQYGDNSPQYLHALDLYNKGHSGKGIIGRTVKGAANLGVKAVKGTARLGVAAAKMQVRQFIFGAKLLGYILASTSILSSLERIRQGRNPEVKVAVIEKIFKESGSMIDYSNNEMKKMAIEIYKYLFPDENQQGRGANGKRKITKIILGSLILMAMTAAGVCVLNDAKWVQSLWKQLSEKYDIKKSQFNNAYNNIVKYFSYEYQDSDEDLAGTVPNDYFAANEGFSDPDEDLGTPFSTPMGGRGLQSQMTNVAKKHNIKRRVRKGVKAGKKAVKNAIQGLKVSDISELL